MGDFSTLCIVLNQLVDIKSYKQSNNGTEIHYLVLFHYAEISHCFV